MTTDSAFIDAARENTRYDHARPGRGATRTAEGARPREAHFIRWARVSDMSVGVLALIGAFVVTNVGRMPNGLGDFLALRLTVKNLLLLLAFALVWRLICTLAGLYQWERVRVQWHEGVRIILAAAVGNAFAVVFPAISLTGAFRFSTVFVSLAATIAAMLVVRGSLRTLIDPEAGERHHLLIVGTGPRGLALGRELTGVSRAQVVGYVDLGSPPDQPEMRDRYLGDLKDLETILLRHTVDEVYVALPVRSHYAEIETTLQVCERTGVPVSWLADQFVSTRGHRRFEVSGNHNVISIDGEQDLGLMMLKRLVDLVGATVGLVLLAPVLALGAVAVKLSSPGPVLYTQDRYGLYRRRFRLYKLRTMVDGADALQESLEALNEASGPVFKIKADPRITRVGRVLRRTSIDEIPQLVNVLRGDMSLVGPRPLPSRDVARFTEGALVRRFSVRPGLTGLWQISGRSELSFDRWIALDLQYIDRWSLGLDARIILKTIPAVLRGTGAT
jgi:exopolysaccharide biosynthesis polyprenyl glycosylphosphotransferase